MNDKYTDSDIHINNKLVEKLDNFWFYHKWHIIISIFVIFALVVCIAQSCSKTDYDVNVLYAGPHTFTITETDSIIEELNGVMPRDFNGDEEKNTAFVTYQVLNTEQMEAVQKKLSEEEEGARLDTSYFTSQTDMYNSAIMTGEYSILLIDETLYQKLANMEGRLRKLSEVLATVPESAFSEYGIRFSETALAKNSKHLGQLPEDTVLCLLSPYVFGASSNEKTYSQTTEMFVSMAKD